MALYQADHDLDSEKALARARSAYEAGQEAFARLMCSRGRSIGQESTTKRNTIRARRYGWERRTRCYFHAGMINYAAGDHQSCRDDLSRAIQINPSFSILYAEEARTTLEALQNAVRS